MKLYYSPGACSIATRIVLHEAGIDAEFEKVDLRAKITESGDDYSVLNPAGAVPLLVLDDGERVSENVAILTLLADRHPDLGLDGPMGRIRLIEMLSFLSTELHAAFKPFFHDVAEPAKVKAAEAVERRLDLLADRMRGPFLFGERFTVADAYLFAMLRWAVGFRIHIPVKLVDLFEHAARRDSVRQAMQEEGLRSPLVGLVQRRGLALVKRQAVPPSQRTPRSVAVRPA